jgi:hypothetical protein
MHGGRSTGPRTQEGLARLRAAHTSTAADAEFRARHCHIMSIARRSQVLCAVGQYLDRLPEVLVARFGQMPPELQMPPYPTGGITVAGDRALQRADAAALAPWRQAIARVRQARRSGQAATAAAGQSGRTAFSSTGRPARWRAAIRAAACSAAAVSNGTTRC